MISQKNLLIFQTVFLTLSIEHLLFGVCFGADDNRLFNDGLCGPRCLKFILDFYGDNAIGIAEIAKDITDNASAGGGGASFTDMEKFCLKHGIYTRFVAGSRSDLIEWPHPVIAHLKGPNYPSGHFCVLLPAAYDGRAHLWYPEKPGTISVEELSSFSKTFSGHALLTSKQAIEPHIRHTRNSRVLDGLIAYGSFLVCALVSIRLARAK